MGWKKSALAFLGIVSTVSAQDLKVSFNRDTHSSYNDPYRSFKRDGRNIENEWVSQIKKAQSRVWIAIYELRLPKIAKALVDAQARGVDVRVVTEDTNNFNFKAMPSSVTVDEDINVNRLRDYFAYADLNQDETLTDNELVERDAMYMLEMAKVPVLDDRADGSKGSGLMHHKFVVIDTDVVLTGSGNLTWSDLHGDALEIESRGNANNFLIFQSEELNELFSEEFSILWGDGPSGKTDSRFGVRKEYREPVTVELQSGEKVTVQFGATSKDHGWEASPNGLISRTLKRAKTNVRAALFAWSEQKLSDILSAQNVETEFFIDESFGYRPFSELLDMFGVERFDEKCELEVGNKVWTNTSLNSGVAQLNKGDKLHHKFAVIDSSIVITGSHNWSSAANNNNDETMLVIESPTIGPLFDEEMDRIGKRALRGITPRLQSQLDAANSACN